MATLITYFVLFKLLFQTFAYCDIYIYIPPCVCRLRRLSSSTRFKRTSQCFRSSLLFATMRSWRSAQIWKILSKRSANHSCEWLSQFARWEFFVRYIWICLYNDVAIVSLTRSLAFISLTRSLAHSHSPSHPLSLSPSLPLSLSDCVCSILHPPPSLYDLFSVS